MRLSASSGTGQASQRQRCLIFKDLPPRPLRAYSPPSAASSAASSVAATRPRPKSLIAASTTKSVSTASHSSAAAASSARPTWSSHDSGRSAVSGTGTTLTRLSAASVRSLFQCPLTKVAPRSQGCCMPGGSCCSAPQLGFIQEEMPVRGERDRVSELLGPCLMRTICSLQGLMKDPVVCADGHTYEVHPRIC